MRVFRNTDNNDHVIVDEKCEGRIAYFEGLLDRLPERWEEASLGAAKKLASQPKKRSRVKFYDTDDGAARSFDVFENRDTSGDDDTTLADELETYSDDELREIARDLKVRGVKNIKKRETLIERIVEAKAAA